MSALKSTLAALAVAMATVTAPAAAAPVAFFTDLSGSAENPANGSTATGSVFVSFDIAAHLMRVVVDFEGLSGPNSAAHIH
jgi:CHRD domain